MLCPCPDALVSRAVPPPNPITAAWAAGRASAAAPPPPIASPPGPPRPSPPQDAPRRACGSGRSSRAARLGSRGRKAKPLPPTPQGSRQQSLCQQRAGAPCPRRSTAVVLSFPPALLLITAKPGAEKSAGETTYSVLYFVKRQYTLAPLSGLHKKRFIKQSRLNGLPPDTHTSLDLITKEDVGAESRAWGWGSVLAPLIAVCMQLMDQHVPDLSLGGTC